MSPQRGRFASEQIYTPEAVLELTNEGQPGWPPGGRFRSVVTGENPSNHVFVDGDVESQGNLLSNSRTAPSGIALLHLDDGFKEFLVGSFWAGLLAEDLLTDHEIASECGISNRTLYR